MNKGKDDLVVTINEIKIEVSDLGKNGFHTMRTIGVCDCPADCGHVLFLFGGTCGIEVGGTNTRPSIYYFCAKRSAEMILYNINELYGEKHD